MAFLLISCELPAQCVPDPIQTRSVEGYLLFGFDGYFRILKNAEVRVMDEYGKKIITSVPVSQDGYFNIVGIKPGKYLLSGLDPKAINAHVYLSVKKKESSPSENSMILIILSADIDSECGGSSITIEPKSKIDKILESLENEPTSNKKGSANQTPL
jgi:hypothetical protein